MQSIEWLSGFMMPIITLLKLSNSSISKDIDLSVDNDEDSGGYYLDSAAEFKEWSNDLTANLSDLEQDIIETGSTINIGIAEMNSLSASNRTPQAYLSISAKVGRRLGEVADRYYDKSQITAKLIYSFEPKMNSINKFLCEQKILLMLLIVSLLRLVICRLLLKMQGKT